MASHEDEISMEMQGTVSSLASVNRRDSVFPGHATDNVDHYLATNFIRNDTAITSASLIYSRAENTGNTPFVVYQRPVDPSHDDQRADRIVSRIHADGPLIRSLSISDWEGILQDRTQAVLIRAFIAQGQTFGDIMKEDVDKFLISFLTNIASILFATPGAYIWTEQQKGRPILHGSIFGGLLFLY